jgi:hypothetical protein
VVVEIGRHDFALHDHRYGCRPLGCPNQTVEAGPVAGLVW